MITLRRHGWFAPARSDRGWEDAPLPATPRDQMVRGKKMGTVLPHNK